MIGGTVSVELFEKIEAFVNSKPVAIFMKGTPEMPMCGFSARACQALMESGVTADKLAAFDIFSDDRVTFEALKQYSQWPTSPQVFIGGQFVGGCDIIVEMFERGELQELVKKELSK